MSRWLAPIRREYEWAEVAQELGLADKLRIVNASITMLRADAHLDLLRAFTNEQTEDCLHSCSPGVPRGGSFRLVDLTGAAPALLPESSCLSPLLAGC